LKSILEESGKMNEEVGSSTALLIKFDNERFNVIKSTNLGDGGYIIFRPSEEDD